MKIGIIGGGAIGLLTAGYLCSGNHQVTVYVKRGIQKQKINENGIKLLPVDKTYWVKALHISEIEQEDLLIVTVKQYHVQDVFQEIAVLPSVPFVFLQNGMGHIDTMKELSQHHSVFAGVLEHGAVRINEHTVEHTGKGLMRLASMQSYHREAVWLADKISLPGFPVTAEEEWFAMLADKLVINAVINPLTALFHVQNGEVIGNRELNRIARKLCQETCQVLNLNAERQWERVSSVCRQTAKNHSSMKKDVESGNRTEIDGISGFLVEQAAEAVIPYTSFVYRSIKALEALSKGDSYA
ncbi:2-dehydropantoate 2-reductase [Sediminibacillus albus]|uniref:2-dehydropantoate 2-reductase n=1 Tax=Sediminibacillus albus TaxID=407036 RepID=A0A1G8W8F7_9BACI|nr:2-dehydropantoate 2-reductase [Sediminibacillus albus]SDJ74406.1 2-dehydropantoate 2-reductase [Sediminibacillus albus]